MTRWDELRRELDAWGDAGRSATMWWRDDDAAEPAAALTRLLDLSGGSGIPVALAVIPASASAALAETLPDYPTATPVQHGYAHLNYAQPRGKNGELGPGRPLAVNARELALGRQRMVELFGAAAFPALVPPWNRIDPALVAHLPGLGFHGLSTYGPRDDAEPAPGLVQVNTHLDIIDWRGSRGFVGEAKALAQLIGHLQARRTGAVDADEASGLLTHHLVHDQGAWDFIATLFAVTSAHPAARWLDAAQLFGSGAAVAGPTASRVSSAS